MEKDDFIYWTRKLYEKGMSPSTSGNVSVLSEDGNILITASGTAAGDIWHDDIVKINFEGELIEGNKKPSSEKLMHIKIYEKRPDIKAIIHSHSPEITAFALCGSDIINVVFPDIVFHFGEIPLVKYYTPGEAALAEDVGQKFLYHNAVLMQNHGVVVGGKNLKETFYALETIQSCSKAYIYAQTIGFPIHLSKKEIKKINSLK